MLFEKVLQQFLNHNFEFIHYILHSHIDLHFLENRNFLLDILYDIELLHYLLLSVNWNIFYIDHNLINRYVVGTSYS